MTEWSMENPQVKGAYNDMPTLEEAQATGEANRLIENNLSSVEISHNSKGTTWKIKVKHEDANKAKGVAIEIDNDLRQKYGIK